MTCLFDLDGVKAMHIVMAAVYPRCGFCGWYFLTATNNGLPGKIFQTYFVGGEHIFNGVTETFRRVSVAVGDLEQKG